LKRKIALRKDKIKQALFLVRIFNYIFILFHSLNIFKNKIRETVELKEDCDINQPNRELAMSIQEAWQAKKESILELNEENKSQPILNDLLPRNISGQQWTQINGLISDIQKVSFIHLYC